MDMKNAKLGKKVEFTRRNGVVAQGVIHSVPEQKPNGAWVQVNTGSGLGHPVLTNVRLLGLRLATAGTAPTVDAPVAKRNAPAMKTVAKKKKK